METSNTQPSRSQLPEAVLSELMDSAARCDNWYFETQEEGFVVGSHGIWRFFLITEGDRLYGHAISFTNNADVQMPPETITSILAEARAKIDCN